MKLSNVAALYAMRLRAQLGQELLAVAGIAVGVSLLFAALVANTSLTGAFERVSTGVVGDARLQLAARGESFLPDMTDAVRRIPGVDAAAPVIEVRGEARGPEGRRSIELIGVTPDFAQLNSALTHHFSYAFFVNVRAIAVPTPLADALGLALGQAVALNLSGRRVDARVAARLQENEAGGLYTSPIAIAPLRYAQELSGHLGAVSRIFVRPLPGRDAAVTRALRRLAAGRADVVPADRDAALFRQASEPTNQSTAMFSVFSAMVGFLFALSAVLLTVPQRRRLVADLRIEGYGPATILKVLLFEALVLGIGASALGLLVGDQFARRLFSQPTFLQMAFPYGSGRIVTFSSVALAAAGGILASAIAVLAPMTSSLLSRDDRPPVAVGRRERTGLVGAGLALLAAGAAIVVAAPSSAGVAILGLACLTLAMLLLLPLLLDAIVAGVDVLTRGMRSIVVFLTITDLRDRTTRLRSLAVAATGAVAVFGSVALQGAHADLQSGLDRTSADLSSIGDLWIVAPGRANLLATAPFRAPALRPPEDVVRDVVAYRSSFLDIGDRRVWVLGAPATAQRPIPRGQMVDGSTRRATRLLRTGGWAVVSSALADQQGWDVGERFTLAAPRPTSLRISALSTNLGWPPGAIVLNAGDYARAWGSDDVSGLQATLAPGATPAQGAQALRAALGPRSGLEVQTAARREHDQRAASREGLTRLTQIAALVLVSAMIAMAAAMAGMIWQRRAFLAAMKVEGYGTSELWRSLLLEAGVLMGAGCLVGAAFGLLGQTLLSRTLTVVTGFPVDPSIAVLGALLSCAAVTAVAVGIIAAFGHRAARVPAETALR